MYNRKLTILIAITQLVISTQPSATAAGGCSSCSENANLIGKFQGECKLAITGGGNSLELADGPNEKRFHISPKVVYELTFTAEIPKPPQNQPPVVPDTCAGNSAKIDIDTTRCGGNLLYWWDYEYDVWKDCPTTIIAYKAPSNWNKEACNPRPIGCGHPDCSETEGCACKCADANGHIDPVFFHTHYVAWTIQSAFILGPQEEESPEQAAIRMSAEIAAHTATYGEALGWEDPSESGGGIFLFKGTNNGFTTVVSCDEETDTTGDDFLYWTESVRLGTVFSPPTICSCYEAIEAWNSISAPQDSPGTLKVLLWMPDWDKRQDEGEGTFESPIGDGGGLNEFGPGGGPATNTLVSWLFGLGRDDEGKAFGVLQLEGDLAAGNAVNKNHVGFADPFGRGGVSIAGLGQTPSGVFRRWVVGNNVMVDLREITSGITLTFHRAGETAAFAVHTMENVVSEGLPGVKYTRVRNGFTQVWEHYAQASNGGRVVRNITPQGDVTTCTDSPIVDDVVLHRPWTRQFTTGKRVGSVIQPKSTRTISYRQVDKSDYTFEYQPITDVTTPFGQPPMTTTYAYYDRDVGAHGGKLKWRKNPDGSWVRYDYDYRTGDLVRTLTPWLSTVSNPELATLNNSCCKTHEIVDINFDEYWDIESVGSMGSYVVTSRSWHRQWQESLDPVAQSTRWASADRAAVDPSAYLTQVMQGTAFRFMTNKDSRAASNISNPGNAGGFIAYQPVNSGTINLDWFNGVFDVDMTQRFSSNYNLWDGQMTVSDPGTHKVRNQVDSAGRVTQTNYYYGHYDADSGEFDWGSPGEAECRTITQYACNPENFVLTAKNPIIEERWLDYQGLERQEMRRHEDDVISTTVHVYDPDRRERVSSTRDGVPIYSLARPSAGVEDVMDQSGIVTRTVTDEDGTVTSTTKLGHDGSPDSVAVTSEDAYSSVSTTSAGTLLRTRTVIRDSVGRTSSETDENGVITTYSYDVANRITTATLPGGGTRITENYIDGRVKRISGTAVVSEYHSYSPLADGSIKEFVYYNCAPGYFWSARWRATTTNSLGWVVEEESPRPGGGTIVTTHTYNTKGQRIKTTTNGMAQMLYVYDTFGKVAAQGYDLNNNNQLDVNSADPITATWQDYTQLNGDWYEVSTTGSFLTETSTAPVVILKQTFRKLGGAQEIVKMQSNDGSLVTEITERDPANKRVTVTTSSNRGGLPVVKVFENGLLISETSTTNSSPTLYSYDPLERLRSVSGPDGISVQTVYDDTPASGGVSIAHDRVYQQITWPQGGGAFTARVTNAYDPLTGRLLSETNQANETKLYGYDVMGRIIRQSGTQGYPIVYEYNGYGELEKMGTFRAEPGTTTMAAATGVTLWTYDPGSGALMSKSSQNQTETNYTYDAAGRVSSRYLQGVGVTCTYSYDLAGRPIATNYSKNGAADPLTPPVSQTYYRNSDLHTTTDANGLHTFVPPVLMDGSGPGQAVETITPVGGVGVNAVITEDRDSAGRRSHWKLQINGATFAEMNQSYEPGTGLLSQIESPGQGYWGYSYQAGTGRIAQVQANIQSSLPLMVNAMRSYDASGRLESIDYAAVPDSQLTGVSPANLGWNYSYDPAHPERRVNSTSRIAGLPGWSYSYNLRGEVIGASRGTGANAATAVPGQTWGYSYDAIGNRTASTRGLTGDGTGGVRATTYTSNDRNQYTSILRPNALEVTGVTNTDIPRVAVNGKPPNSGRPPGNGEPGGFAQWLDNIATTSNGSDGIGRWPQISILVGKNDNSHFTRNGRSYVRPSETGTLGLTYDGQGNLIQDACWRYTWDGENRLVAMEMRADGGIPIVPIGTNPVKLTKVEFDYDALGRRIAKRVKQRTTALELWQTLSHTRFWYDGWNLIAETNAAGQLVRRYIWGTDLSGTPQGAGGVGALLGIEVMRTTGPKLYLVCTEANGNVMGLVDGETGALAARFDYDPFGNQVTDWRAANVDADGICPFRFSTKYTDVETGLVYYGYRYYSPELGRWMNRDPIGIRGGLNLYGMVGNDAVSRMDLLGLIVFDFQGPGWGTWNKGYVIDRGKEIDARMPRLVELMHQWTDLAKQLCDKCEYKKPLLEKLKGVKGIVDGINGSIATANIRVRLKDLGEKEDYAQEVHNWITGSRWIELNYHSGELNFFGDQLEARKTLFHELTHQQGSIDGGLDVSKDAHFLEWLVDDTGKFSSNLVKELIAKHGKKNCPYSEGENAPLNQQWPKNE